MRMHLRVAHLLVLLVLVVNAPGCSTYEVRDVLVAQETGKYYVGFGDGGVSANIQFGGKLHFSSVGMFGMPVIPAYASDKPPAELKLQVELRLDRVLEYSLAAAPCLATEAGPLCPNRLEISPMFWTDAAILRDARGNDTYGRIPALAGRPPLNRPTAGLEAGARVTRDDIEGDFGYHGDPPWTGGLLRVTYAYRCAGTCPAQFTLTSDDIVVAGDSLRSAGIFHFETRRIKDYRGLTEVQ